MNRNHMLKRKMTAGLAVGMAVAVGSVPMAMAANTANTKDSSSSVSKEETVYVNADASGNPQQITVSNWLKNAGSESSVEDQSDLTNIKNVKGDETFSENGDSLTWNTDGSDIYYQGQSNKDLPVSVKFTYLLDGQEMQPQDLVGKSGHLQIKIQYTNNEKKSAKVDGKKETIYSPFVMMTALIFPDVRQCSASGLDHIMKGSSSHENPCCSRLLQRMLHRCRGGPIHEPRHQDCLP